MNGLKSFRIGQKHIFTPFVIQLLLIMFIIEFVKGAVLISILPVYMKSVLGISTFLIGWTLALQYIGDNLFRSPIGWIIDKAGYRPVMLTGVILTFVSVAVLVAFTHYFWLIIACTLLGIGTSPLWPCVITGATESGGDETKGTMMSVIYMSWLTGVGLGPVVINFFITETYAAAFRLLVVLMVACVIISLFLPGSRKGGGLRNLFRELRPPRPAKHAKAGISGRYAAWWKERLARIRRYIAEANASLAVSWVFYPALFAQSFALGLLTPVLTLYARTVLVLSPAQYSYFLIAGGAITVLFLIPVGKLVDRWGVKWFLDVGLILSSVTLIAFTYFRSVPMLFVLVAALGIGYALIIPSWNALIASVIPQEKRGAIWGFFLTIEGSGMVIGPIVAGKLWDSAGYHAPFVTSGLVLLGLFVLQLFIFIDRKVMVR